MKKTLLKMSAIAAAMMMMSSVSHADNEFKGKTVRVKLLGGTQYETLYAAIPEWEKKTGAKVDVISRKSHFELDREIKQDMASGKIDYCVASNHTSFAPQYGKTYRDLTGLIPASFLANFQPLLLKHSTVDGKLVQIPRQADISELYYNKVVYENPENKAAYKAKFGKDLAPPETWDEAKQQAIFFAKPPAFYGTQFAGKDEAITGRFYEMLVANGGSMFGKNWKATFNSPQGVKSLDWFVDLYKAGAVPKGSPNYVWDDLGNGFASGTVAFDLDWGGWASYFNDPKSSKIAGQVGIVRAPKGDSGRRTGWAGSHSFSMTVSCPEPQAAASLIMHLTSFDAQMLEAKKGLITSRKDVQAAALKLFTDSGDKYLEQVYRVFSEGVSQDAFTPPLIPEWIEVSNAIWPELQKAIIGDKTSKAALDAAAKKVDEILQDSGRQK